MVSSAAMSADARIGTTVAGRYHILQKLGEGGMGAVYRGVHAALRKPVAVKFLLGRAQADGELAARFEREAVAAANLKHPNIAEATDYGQLPDGTLFLVMEYVEGKSLRDLLSWGRLPPARAFHLLRQVGAALTFAHGFEVVHRDLKPDNVIVFDRGGESDLVKVIDFGIAHMRSAFGGGPTALTRMGSVFGTPDYIAPEQAMGQQVDPRGDQYALGVIAFEMLAGQRPFKAKSALEMVQMQIRTAPPSLLDLAPGLPPAAATVVQKMLAKRPDERFTDVTSAVLALGQALGA